MNPPHTFALQTAAKHQRRPHPSSFVTLGEAKRSRRTCVLLAAVAALTLLGSTSSIQAQPDQQSGAATYAEHCAICHGDNREGNLPAFPPLVGIGHQMTDAQITTLIHNGKGRMPAFPKLATEEVTALVHFLTAPPMAETVADHPAENMGDLAQQGRSIFQQNCAFCHGRDAMGGETGPDLTRSKLVLADIHGDKISEVVRNGRPEKKMPAFNFSSQEMLALAAWIHGQVAAANSGKGGRRGVDVADLQTGNVAAGLAYFNGAGGCAQCHSPTGDLAGVASRYEGLKLEERMLYPEDAISHVTVTLSSGKKITGVLAYQDEFTIGLRDSTGVYHSWATRNVRFSIDAPVEAHVALFPKYTDDDIHNLMAFIQTLK